MIKAEQNRPSTPPDSDEDYEWMQVSFSKVKFFNPKI